MYSGLEHWDPVPGTDDVDKRDVVLTMGTEELRFVIEKRGEAPTLTIPYADVTYAGYALYKRPRWGLGAGLPCLAVALFKKKSHWLGLDTEANGPMLFKLHKRNYGEIVARLEARGIVV